MKNYKIKAAGLFVIICLLFTELLTESLSKEGFRTYINQKVPSGDGGLALGQLYYAVLEHEGR